MVFHHVELPESVIVSDEMSGHLTNMCIWDLIINHKDWYTRFSVHLHMRHNRLFDIFRAYCKIRGVASDQKKFFWIEHNTCDQHRTDPDKWYRNFDHHLYIFKSRAAISEALRMCTIRDVIFT